MKIYLAEYEHCPSTPESSVIMADSEEEAMEIAKEIAYYSVESVEEIDLHDQNRQQVIYTGNSCC